ncbi:DNA-processing protein DprA [Thorsellia anophelis]|uniref:DNA processing protein n=1 Tax=Thorsellia anophelis DSM 18579 TaxID=1123402 RepID=A0A1H9Y2E2_9GAMM|nr:DNA-processing protein DprA [Thorsellia anophelis]SES62995.1 DNA processing protein [Thorsellia anophelis DSM 18579]
MLKEELWMRLNTVHALSIETWTSIESHFSHNVSNNLAQNSEILSMSGLNPLQIKQFFEIDSDLVNKTLKWLETSKRYILPISSHNYPSNLKNIDRPPNLLFVEGDVALLHAPQLVIVGSRRATHYGQFWANKFACELSKLGFVITSGLARGIDQTVHQSLLRVKGKTIAVLGSGLNDIYPSEHTALADKIVEHGGTLVSPFYPDTKQTIHHFSAKNHLMSALGNGILVIEATLKSGSLMTARFALEQGKDIFALPGPLGNKQSQGTHWLIKQGANLASDPQDILEHIQSNFNWLNTDNPER